MRSLGVISVPNPSTAPCVRADLLDRLGGIAAERVWSAPAPGTATSPYTRAPATPRCC